MKRSERDLRADVLLWLASGETGTSSKAIAFTLLGVPGTHFDYPHDGGDFGRCVRLLRFVPKLRRRLPLMRKVSLTWARLVDNWAELEALYDEDVAHHPVPHPEPLYPRTYARMKELRL